MSSSRSSVDFKQALSAVITHFLERLDGIQALLNEDAPDWGTIRSETELSHGLMDIFYDQYAGRIYPNRSRVSRRMEERCAERLETLIRGITSITNHVNLLVPSIMRTINPTDDQLRTTRMAKQFIEREIINDTTWTDWATASRSTTIKEGFLNGLGDEIEIAEDLEELSMGRGRLSRQQAADIERLLRDLGRAVIYQSMLMASFDERTLRYIRQTQSSASQA